MTKYISELSVSLDVTEERELQAQGFTKINVNLNEGAGGNIIYLWYKHGPQPITRLQLTFNHGMAVGMKRANYTKISKSLTTGTAAESIYLWHFSGSGQYDEPIVEIDVTQDAKAEARKFTQDWERLACNLNRGTEGKVIHIWVKRQNPTYICDVTASDSFTSDEEKFTDGYIRLDEDTNKDAAGAELFIWYRQTNDSKRAITALQVSVKDSQFNRLQQEKYTQVKVNLNQGTGGHQVYLWYNEGKDQNPVKAFTVLVNQDQFQQYEMAGANVVKRNLNEGNPGCVEYLSVNQ